MRTARLLTLILFWLTACSSPQPATRTVHEVTGTQAARIEAVTARLGLKFALPAAILDAHLIEERIGDDNLGPSDSRTFLHLVAAPAAITEWQATLAPYHGTASYAAPTDVPLWWITEERFSHLAHYSSETLFTGQGWIALDPVRGEIFIYFSTT